MTCKSSHLQDGNLSWHPCFRSRVSHIKPLVSPTSFRTITRRKRRAELDALHTSSMRRNRALMSGFRSLGIGSGLPWEPTFPSFLRVITHIFGLKTYVFPGFGVQGWMLWKIIRKIIQTILKVCCTTHAVLLQHYSYNVLLSCVLRRASLKRYTLHSSCFLNNCQNKSHPRYVWAGEHVYDFPSEVPDFPEEGS